MTEDSQGIYAALGVGPTASQVDPQERAYYDLSRGGSGGGGSKRKRSGEEPRVEEVVSLDTLCRELVDRIASACAFKDARALYTALYISNVPDTIVRAECARLNVALDGKTSGLGTPRICRVLSAFQRGQYPTKPTTLTYLLNLWASRALLNIPAAGGSVAAATVLSEARQPYRVYHYQQLHYLVQKAGVVGPATVDHPFWKTMMQRCNGFLGGVVAAATSNWTIPRIAATNMAAALRHGFQPADRFQTRWDQLDAGLRVAGVTLRPALRRALAHSEPPWISLLSEGDSDRCSAIAVVVGAVVLGTTYVDELVAALDHASRAVVRSDKSISFSVPKLVADTAAVAVMMRTVHETKPENADRVSAYLRDRGITAKKRSRYDPVIELVAAFMTLRTALLGSAVCVYRVVASHGVPTAHVIEYVSILGETAPVVIRRLAATGLFAARPCALPSVVLDVLTKHGIAAFDRTCMLLLADQTLSTSEAFELARLSARTSTSL